MSSRSPIVILAVLLIASSCAQEPTGAKKSGSQTDATMPSANHELATFGAGCFWCVEAIYQQLDGVLMVESGYAGGGVPNPTYEQVCSGKTGHAEVSQITYDPGRITYEALLEVFFSTHDPTTLNRQGNDVGTQYRSVIFYHSDRQKEVAERIKKELDQSGAFAQPIVTEITPFKTFYKAEDYHQNYYNENGSQPYCRLVIAPKLEKFKKVFASKMTLKAKP